MSDVFIFPSLHRPCGFDQITSKRSGIKKCPSQHGCTWIDCDRYDFRFEEKKPGIESLIPLGRYGQACEVAEAV